VRKGEKRPPRLYGWPEDEGGLPAQDAKKERFVIPPENRWE
jgi:hypothetical protein